MRTRESGLAGLGSVVSAAASSACCWLPLVLVGTGVSATGAAAFFERWRPFFLVPAAGLLVLGFYLEYARREPCGPDGSCPSPRPRRWRRGMLWISTALVLAFTLFPNYVGLLLAHRSDANAAAKKAAATLILDVGGMTCGGCEATAEAALLAVPGVLAAKASYERARAVLTVDGSSPPSRVALAAALRKVGYRLEDSAESADLSGQWQGKLSDADGDSVTIVLDLGRLGSRWVGEFDLPDHRVENYPVEVTLEGSSVRLHFTALEMDFAGSLMSAGRVLSGALIAGETVAAMAFHRLGEVRFSEEFLELEAAAEDATRVRELAADGAQLKESFNRDVARVRLLMLLAPS